MTPRKVIGIGIAANVLKVVSNVVKTRNRVAIRNNVKSVSIQILLHHLRFEGLPRYLSIGSTEGDSWCLALSTADDGQTSTKTVTSQLDRVKDALLLDIIDKGRCHNVEADLFQG